MDLSEIEILEKDRKLIIQARREVEAQAQKMLHTGVINAVSADLHAVSADLHAVSAD